MWAVVAQAKTKTIEKFQMASTSVKCIKKKKNRKITLSNSMESLIFLLTSPMIEGKYKLGLGSF
jgi:hypothetical protein